MVYKIISVGTNGNINMVNVRNYEQAFAIAENAAQRGDTEISIHAVCHTIMEEPPKGFVFFGMGGAIRYYVLAYK